MRHFLAADDFADVDGEPAGLRCADYCHVITSFLSRERKRHDHDHVVPFVQRELVYGKRVLRNTPTVLRLRLPLKRYEVC